MLGPRGSTWSFQKFRSPIRGKNQWQSFQEGGGSRGPKSQDWQDGIKGSEHWHSARKMMFHCDFRIWAAWPLAGYFTPLGFHPSVANSSFGRRCSSEILFLRPKCQYNAFLEEMNVYFKSALLERTADPLYLNFLARIVVPMRRPLCFHRKEEECHNLLPFSLSRMFLW